MQSWAFLSDQANQRTLGWIGGEPVVLAGGLWAVIKFFMKPATSQKAPPERISVSADRGGVAGGRDVNIGSLPEARPKPLRRRG
ncbi:MAG: hypothetical protein R3C69_15995 [Geminicoccaceae bacterium]